MKVTFLRSFYNDSQCCLRWEWNSFPYSIIVSKDEMDEMNWEQKTRDILKFFQPIAWWAAVSFSQPFMQISFLGFNPCLFLLGLPPSVGVISTLIISEYVILYGPQPFFAIVWKWCRFCNIYYSSTASINSDICTMHLTLRKDMTGVKCFIFNSECSECFFSLSCGLLHRAPSTI